MINSKDNIINAVNQIIDDLFIKDKYGKRIEVKSQIGFDSEPINWGDLDCYDAEKLEDGSWIIYIEEAAPEGCPDFCEYIESEMKKKGYDVKVITEW
jgi:hypothetical protein